LVALWWGGRVLRGGGGAPDVTARRRIWRRWTKASIDKRKRRRIANLAYNDVFDLYFHSSSDPDFPNLWPTSWLV
jgi:hypothetical protein